MVYIKIVFTLEYDEDLFPDRNAKEHPIYIDAIACFHVTLRKTKLRNYMIEKAKSRLLYQLDYYFTPFITDLMTISGIEKITDREAKQEGLKCSEYPNVDINIIWKHHKEDYIQSVKETERV